MTKNNEMPDVLYIDEPIEQHNGDLLYEGRASRFHARHKYIRADKGAESMDDVDKLAQFIRVINGDNKMGAAELAEKILQNLSTQKPKPIEGLDEAIESEFIYDIRFGQRHIKECILQAARAYRDLCKGD